MPGPVFGLALPIAYEANFIDSLQFALCPHLGRVEDSLLPPLSDSTNAMSLSPGDYLLFETEKTLSSIILYFQKGIELELKKLTPEN